MKYILIYYRYVCTEVCLRNILLYTPLFDYKKSLKRAFLTPTTEEICNICLRNILLYISLFDYKQSLIDPFSHPLQ